MRRLAALAILLAVTISSPAWATMSGDKAGAKAQLAARMLQPSKALYRQVYVVRLPEGPYYFCGEVNAADATGAYVGYVPFVASPEWATAEGWILDEDQPSVFSQLYQRWCVDKPKVRDISF